MMVPARASALILAALSVSLVFGSIGLPTVAANHSTWPDIDTAVIRPGIKLQVDGRGFCTANFVFKDAAGDLYIGMAGHCAGPFHGANVRLPDDLYYVTRNTGLIAAPPIIGTVAYSSWFYLGVNTEPCFPPVPVLSCGTGDDGGDDFALVKINSAYHNLVHPAVLHFGGPTAVASWSDVQFLDRVITYGNSPVRPGPEQLDWHYGVVTGWDNPSTVYQYTVGPGIPGDSGSGVMLFEGKALGVLVTLNLAGGENGVAFLEYALQRAASRGVNVTLQTWSLLNGGL